MPHCIIEVTKNISKIINHERLMKDVSNAINIESSFVIDDIKIRILELEHSFMGVETQEHSYVATEIILLNNKSEDLYKKIQESVHNIINMYFQKVICKCSITTRLTLVDSKNYLRSVNY